MNPADIAKKYFVGLHHLIEGCSRARDDCLASHLTRLASLTQDMYGLVPPSAPLLRHGGDDGADALELSAASTTSSACRSGLVTSLVLASSELQRAHDVGTRPREIDTAAVLCASCPDALSSTAFLFDLPDVLAYPPHRPTQVSCRNHHMQQSWTLMKSRRDWTPCSSLQNESPTACVLRAVPRTDSVADKKNPIKSARLAMSSC